MNPKEMATSIAVIGMSGRFPGARNTKEFWHNLITDQETITFFSTEELQRAGVSEALLQNPNYVKASPAIADSDMFDAAFFGFTPKEAQGLDAQKRLLMETAWEALEDAGYTPEVSDGRIGVYAGCRFGYNYPSNADSNYILVNFQEELFEDKDYLATYTSYKLNLKGPSLSIQTACSTSLVTVCLACQDLISHNCDLALAGGVALRWPATGYLYDGGLESPDGHCRTFDAEAQGTVFGSGVGLVALKRLQEAIDDGDHIYAVIRGVAVNNDGGQKSGYSAPSQAGQTQVVSLAQQMAGVSPETITYVEAHGTGTRVGDPIEVAGLTEAFRRQTLKKQFCAIGSVKTNIGHLDRAAGIAGVIKTVLALYHRQLPASLHFKTPNPAIDFANSPFYVNTKSTDWQTTNGIPRRAAVNAFGMGGTNAHAILEEAPQVESQDWQTPLAPARPTQIFTLSGKTEQALADQVSQYLDYLNHHSDLNLADVCYTANTGRVHFEHRVAVVAKDVAELQAKLAAAQQGKTVGGLAVGQTKSEKPKIAFLFTGQGAQQVDMGRELYETQPLFRELLTQCDQILQPYLEKSLLELLYGDAKEANDQLLSQTKYTQPALFAIEYALAKLWQSWGIEPTAVIGHSVGEYVAACLAGVFSLADGLKLIAERGRLMQALPPNGIMVAVMADEARLRPMLEPYRGRVSIAGFNAPQSLVLSGEREAANQLIAQLQAVGIKCKPLNVSHAFHSPLMEPMLAEFGQIARTVNYAEPQLQLLSNLRGELLTNLNADYWVEHIRQPVRFAQGMVILAELGIDTFLEIGPKPTLLGMGQQCLNDPEKRLWLPSLYPNQQSDWAQLLESLAKLQVRGGSINWLAFDKPYPRRRLSLPTYPFQRQRYGVKRPSTTSRPGPAGHPLLGERLPPLATSREIAFQNRLSANYPAYLNDHRIYAQVIMPATAYLEMALSAGQQIYAGENYVLHNVVLLQPLLLSAATENTVQLVLSPTDSGDYQWQIFSLKPATDDWQLHVSGELRTSVPDSHSGKDHSLPILQQRCAKEIDLEAYNTALPEAFYFGPDFQGLSQLFQGEQEALGLIKLPANLTTNDYQIHPVLLDCCLRVVFLIIPVADADIAYLPFSCEQVRLFTKTPLTSVWCHVKSQGELSGTLQLDLTLFDEAGQRVATLTGFGFRQTHRQALTGLSLRTDWLYELVWPEAPLPQQSPYTNAPGHWLIVSEPTIPMAEALAELLRTKGETVDLLAPTATRNTLQAAPVTNYRGVIYLAGQPNRSQNDIPDQALEISCQVLELVQNLIKAETKLDLWLVVQDSVEESVLWGLNRTLLWELPQLNSRCLGMTTGTTAKALFDVIWNADGENQIRLGNGPQRQVARLEQLKLSAGNQPYPYPFRVQLSEYGLMDSLQLVSAHRQEPQAHQVEVQVRAVGLNFRDVLGALGVLRPYYPPELGFEDPKKLPFGFEAAGVVTRVGDAITEFQVGDEVMVWSCFGSLATFIMVDKHRLSRKPQHLSFEEAVTIPVTFVTAYYGLIELANMQAGDKVLIHAAAGGVGQAAVQLAQYIGAEIFATASPPKWDFLKSQGVNHIMNSRTLEFADQLQELTHGQGINIVLNSLVGEYIPKNFDVLAKQGRFIELSKREIWTQEQAKSYRPDVEYAPFDLFEEASSDKIFGIQKKLEELLVEKRIKPLPHHVFPIEKVTAAFQFMAQAKQVGKVVLSIPAQLQLPGQKRIQPDKSYLITGGLGGLGLKVAEWLVTQGATHLVLSSRQGATTAAAQSAIAALESQGAKIKAVKADVAQAEEVKNLLQTSQEFAPLRGIIHAAGVLADGVVSQQTPARFAQVFAPKVQGSWYLHQYSQELPLDFFVCFSSQTSLLGNGGQVNYAAANAFMDALMQQRHRMGLPALSINWGAWSGVGMAKEMEIAVEAIAPKLGVELLGALLGQALPQVGVLPEKWPKFSQRLPSLAGFPVLSKLIKPKATTTTRQPILSQLNQASAEERYELLKNFIRAEVEQLTGIVPTDDQGFLKLGMDSLMLIGLTNRLNAALQISLSLPTVLSHDTVELLAQQVEAWQSLQTMLQAEDMEQEDYEEGIL